MNKKETSTVTMNGEKREILFSLCHTTAREPEVWSETIQMWKDRADHPELVEHVFVVDDPTWTFLRLKMNPIFENTTLGHNDKRKCCVDGWNKAAEISHGKFLINVADDLFPPEHWDTLLLRELNNLSGGGKHDGFGTHGQHWSEREVVLDVETGAPGWTAAGSGLLTFCFVTRKYYNRYGYLLYPGYLTVYSDNDFTDQARKDGVVVDARHLKFEHRHPIYDPNVKTDAVYENQSRSEAWEIGRKVYIERSRGRGYHVKKKLAICLPGEHFSSAWVMHWTQLFSQLMPHFDLVPLFCYTSNVYVTRAALANGVVESKPSPDYVLWIDDDNLLTYEQFCLMLKDLEDNPQIDSLSAWAWIQGDVTTTKPKVSVGMMDGYNCRALRHEEMMKGNEDLIRVDWTGFPAVLMKYEALVRVGGHKAFQPVPVPDNTSYPYGFYGEDNSFSVNAQKHGVRMYVDRRIRVPHLKLRDAEPIMPATTIDHDEETAEVAA
jgi:hypothetical protein